MATVTKPIALDESFNTTEQTPRNVADVLAQELSRITGRNASQVEYDNTDSGLTADNVQDALDEIVEDIPTVPSVDIQTAVDEFSTYNGGILDSLKVSLTPNQDLHGYDSPWVGGTGKNKLNSTLVTASTKNGITCTPQFDDGGNLIGYQLSGTATANADFQLHNAYGSTDVYIPSGTYKANNTGAINGIEFHNGYGNDSYPVAYGNTDTEITCLNGISWTILRVTNGTVINTPILVQPMIRLATVTDDTFEPYSNICPISGHTQVDVDVSDGETTQEQVTVNLGGTYYSGTLDVVSGVLTVDRKEVDLGSLTWTYRSELQLFQCVDTGFDYSLDATKENISSCYKYNGIKSSGAAAVSSRPCFSLYTGNRWIWISDRRFTDTTAFEASLVGQTAVLFITPTPIQLSPTMVKALVGENHLSAPLEGQEITESKYKQMFTFDDVIAYIQSLS